ncbi:class I SAM-dependent methyltransferase [Candidatus Woesearchaeota archaeon]|nr:class I SAM-dependent methyltransferase [Candidatus Woesearchaeota archaeon]
MSKIEKGVVKYYTAKEEVRRLFKDPYHSVERIITLQFLKKHLPKRGIILDAGGGTGPYAIELAKQGYRVVLLDLTPKHIEIAHKLIKKERLEDRIKTVVGSITDLRRFKNGTFDAVLCLGATLCHVTKFRSSRKPCVNL